MATYSVAIPEEEFICYLLSDWLKNDKFAVFYIKRSKVKFRQALKWKLQLTGCQRHTVAKPQ